MSMDNLNPQIRTVEIGTRTLRNITLYPLSYGDQKKLINTIKDKFFSVMENFSGEINPNIVVNQDEEKSDVDLVNVIFEALHENFEYILELVTDDKVTLDEMTNFQVSEIIKNVYEVNFDEPKKNLPNMLQKGIQSLWKKLSQAYLKDTTSTE